MSIRSRIRAVPDYPRTGVVFRDISPLLLDPLAISLTVKRLASPYVEHHIDKVAGIESRGFILGGAVALHLGCGFIPLRKEGKLPLDTYGKNYDLEYGNDRLEMHKDAVVKGDKVLLIDDLIATGGTAGAAVQIITSAGGHISGASFVIELPELGGRKILETLNQKVISLCIF